MAEESRAGKRKSLVTVIRRGKPVLKTVWFNEERSSDRINYLRDTIEVHKKLSVGSLYSSVKYGDVKYLGRSASDGRLEFRILDKKYLGKKLRLSVEQYNTEISDLKPLLEDGKGKL